MGAKSANTLQNADYFRKVEFRGHLRFNKAKVLKVGINGIRPVMYYELRSKGSRTFHNVRARIVQSLKLFKNTKRAKRI